MGLGLWSCESERNHGRQRQFLNMFDLPLFIISQVDFYNDLAAYLSELGNTTIRSLEDLVAFNDAANNLASEGGEPVSVLSREAVQRSTAIRQQNVAAAFESGQDGLLASLATKGIQNSTYKQALVSRLKGPFSPLDHPEIDLVPSHVSRRGN